MLPRYFKPHCLIKSQIRMVPLKSLPFLVATRNYEPKSLNLKSTYLISIRLRQLSNPLQLLSQFSLSVLQCLVHFQYFYCYFEYVKLYNRICYQVLVWFSIVFIFLVLCLCVWCLIVVLIEKSCAHYKMNFVESKLHRWR